MGRGNSQLVGGSYIYVHLTIQSSSSSSMSSIRWRARLLSFLMLVDFPTIMLASASSSGSISDVSSTPRLVAASAARLSFRRITSSRYKSVMRRSYANVSVGLSRQNGQGTGRTFKQTGHLAVPPLLRMNSRMAAFSNVCLH